MMNQSIPQLTGPVPYQGEEIGLANYLDILWENRWLIATIAIVVTLLGGFYAFIAKPVYRANMMIHVEEEGPKEAKNIVGDMSSMFDVKTYAGSEIEMVQSRYVVSHAIDNLRLYINARPKYFPLVGSWIAKHHQGLSAPGILGYGGYAWGDEHIDVGTFNVPDALLNKQFVLTVESGGRFTVSQDEAGIELKGRTGVPLSFDTPSGTIELQVEQLAANPGTEFLLARSSRLATIQSVQKSLKAVEEGNNTGIVDVTLEGHDPQMVYALLTEIGKEYMKQNASRKTEQAQKSLAYLDKQLPQIKQQMETAEAKYNAFRNANGTVDASEEAKLSLEQESTAKLKKMELQQKRLDLMSRFMLAHPAVEAVDSQLREINQEIGRIGAHIKTLPTLEQNLVRLSRDVKVNTDLYTELLNSAQQLRLITAGKISNVRLVDMPMRPEKPIKPKRSMIVAVAALAGLFLGVLLAFFRKSLRSAVDAPEQIEKMIGVPVYATIPHSRKQKELYQQVNSRQQKVPLLASVSSTDAAIESLRSFRAALQFSLPQHKNNIVLISGATPGMGKSFVSANLAALMAATGKKVLLIDCDLRNGLLHLYFGFGRQDGLSDAIAGARRPEQVIHRGVIENMDFISTGTLPPNPAELLLRPGFGAMLQQFSAAYDLVLVDAPPILAVADTLIIGAHVGAIYITTRAGVTTAGEIAESMKRLGQAGLAAKGVLFNDLKARPGRYGYGYDYGLNNGQHAGNTPLIEASPGLR